MRWLRSHGRRMGDVVVQAARWGIRGASVMEEYRPAGRCRGRVLSGASGVGSLPRALVSSVPPLRH